MIFILLQALILLIVLNVLVSRFVRRRSTTAKQAMTAEEAELATLDRRIVEAHRAVQVGQNRLTALADNVQVGEAALASAEKELAKVRAAPVDRYYVFDRLEPRIGVIWNVRVRLVPDGMPDRRLVQAWSEDRTYLVISGSQSEAEERTLQRFPRGSGFEIMDIKPCPLFHKARGDDNRAAGSARDTGGHQGGHDAPPERKRA